MQNEILRTCNSSIGTRIYTVATGLSDAILVSNEFFRVSPCNAIIVIDFYHAHCLDRAYYFARFHISAKKKL